MKLRIGILVLIVIAAYAGYQAFVFYDNNFTLGRMWETPAVRPLEEPSIIAEQGLVPFHGGDGFYKAAGKEATVSPYQNPTPEIILQGQIAYGKFCIHCHGVNLDGNGTVGQSFSPLPTNLTGPAVLAQSDGQLFHGISFGQRREPPLATTVSVDDRWAIFAFIRDFAKKKNASN